MQCIFVSHWIFLPIKVLLLGLYHRHSHVEEVFDYDFWRT